MLWQSMGEHHQQRLEIACRKPLCILASSKQILCMGMLSEGQGSSTQQLRKEATCFLLFALSKDQFSSL